MIQTTTFLALALLGAVNAGYLMYKHRAEKGKPLMCPLNHDCSTVTESRFATLLGIRNEVLGFLFFVLMFTAMVASLILISLQPTIYLFIRIGATAGAAFSAVLVVIQFFRLKDYCFYCMISAMISVLLCVNAFYL